MWDDKINYFLASYLGQNMKSKEIYDKNQALKWQKVALIN